MHIRRSRYLRHRFPPEIISHAVWLYHRYCLSFRDVEDLLAERGIIVSYETIRQWCGKFGPDDARRLKRRQGRLGDTWFLDEVFVAINGQRQYLWRAVDQDGDLIDLLVQPRRDGRAARRFFRKLLKSQRQEPCRLVTDKLDGTGNAYDRHMECVESGRRREDVAPVHWRVHQAGLHRWRPGLSTALQRPVRPDEIVRAAQAVDVPVELVGATGVAGRATAPGRRALANREVETLDERGVQGLGILRLPQRSLQPTRRADPPAPFDSDDAIVPPSVEHVKHWLRWSARHKWVSRSLARDEWIARTSDEQIVSNVTACKLALTTRAHDFLKANDGPNFLRAARALSLHFPPIQRVADVSERIEDLSDVPDTTLEERRAIRDAARQKNE